MSSIRLFNNIPVDLIVVMKVVRHPAEGTEGHP